MKVDMNEQKKHTAAPRPRLLKSRSLATKAVLEKWCVP